MAQAGYNQYVTLHNIKSRTPQQESIYQLYKKKFGDIQPTPTNVAPTLPNYNGTSTVSTLPNSTGASTPTTLNNPSTTGPASAPTVDPNKQNTGVSSTPTNVPPPPTLSRNVESTNSAMKAAEETSKAPAQPTQTSVINTDPKPGLYEPKPILDYNSDNPYGDPALEADLSKTGTPYVKTFKDEPKPILDMNSDNPYGEPTSNTTTQSDTNVASTTPLKYLKLGTVYIGNQVFSAKDANAPENQGKVKAALINADNVVFSVTPDGKVINNSTGQIVSEDEAYAAIQSVKAPVAPAETPTDIIPAETKPTETPTDTTPTVDDTVKSTPDTPVSSETNTTSNVAPVQSPDIMAAIEQATNARKESRRSALSNIFNTTNSNLDRELRAAGQNYYNESNKESAGAQLRAKKISDMMRERGYSEGAQALKEVTGNVSLQGTLGGLKLQKLNNEDDISRRRTLASQELASGIAQADADADTWAAEQRITELGKQRDYAYQDKVFDENTRQFNLSFNNTVQQQAIDNALKKAGFEEGIRQFDLSRMDSKEQLAFDNALKEAGFKEGIRQFDKTFEFDNKQFNESTRQFNLTFKNTEEQQKIDNALKKAGLEENKRQFDLSRMDSNDQFSLDYALKQAGFAEGIRQFDKTFEFDMSKFDWAKYQDTLANELANNQFNWQKDQAILDRAWQQGQFDYQKARDLVLDDRYKAQWQQQLDEWTFNKEQVELDNLFRQDQFDYAKAQDKIAQSNYSKELKLKMDSFAYQKAQDKINIDYQKSRDKVEDAYRNKQFTEEQRQFNLSLAQQNKELNQRKLEADRADSAQNAEFILRADALTNESDAIAYKAEQEARNSRPKYSDATKFIESSFKSTDKLGVIKYDTAKIDAYLDLLEAQGMPEESILAIANIYLK